MRCPRCGADEDRVIDSRVVKDGSGIRRRRECSQCQLRFSTLEMTVPEELKVIKRNGEREEFSRDKLHRGIAHACYKRSISEENIDRAVAAVSASLFRDFEREVSSREIGERVMNELRALDEVAYVRFASVYRKFAAAEDFVDEIKGLQTK